MSEHPHARSPRYSAMLAVALAPLLAAAAVAPSPAPADAGHDFHVSRLTVNYNTARRRLELTLDTFVDDLELALGQPPERGPTAEELDLASPTEHPTADSLLAEYLGRTLALESARARSGLEYLGKQAADDPYAVYAFLAADLPAGATLPDLRLRSTFLLELYDDQQNIVVWQRDGQTVDYDLLTAGERVARPDA